MITIKIIKKDDTKRIEYIGNKTLPIYYSAFELFMMMFSSSYIILKASYNETVVGFCVIQKFKNDKRLHIMSIGVLDEYRKKGIGGALMKKLQVIANDESYDKISLYVKVDNDLAINFYTKNNFKNIELLKNYYSSFKNNDAYYLIHEL